jgi:hypothetical protein
MALRRMVLHFHPSSPSNGHHGLRRHHGRHRFRGAGVASIPRAWLARRLSASARVGASGWAARHTSIAPIIGLCSRTTTCSPGPVVRGGPGFFRLILLAGIDLLTQPC